MGEVAREVPSRTGNRGKRDNEDHRGGAGHQDRVAPERGQEPAHGSSATIIRATRSPPSGVSEPSATRTAIVPSAVHDVPPLARHRRGCQLVADEPARVDQRRAGLRSGALDPAATGLGDDRARCARALPAPRRSLQFASQPVASANDSTMAAGSTSASILLHRVGGIAPRGGAAIPSQTAAVLVDPVGHRNAPSEVRNPSVSSTTSVRLSWPAIVGHCHHSRAAAIATIEATLAGEESSCRTQRRARLTRWRG